MQTPRPGSPVRQTSFKPLSIGFALALVASVAAASPSSGQGALGLVLDAENHSPIPGAEVYLVNAEGEFVASGVSDQDGRYLLLIGEEGTYDVIASNLGYHTNSGSTIKLEGTGMTWVEVEPAPDAIEIPGLTVTQQPYVRTLDVRGYYTRKRSSLGRFIEPTSFEKNMHVPVREFLRRTPLFRSQGPLGGRCRTAVVVNGMLRRRGLSSPDLRTRFIAGIDVYSSRASAPPELQSLAPRSCSMIVTWTDYGG